LLPARFATKLKDMESRCVDERGEHANAVTGVPDAIVHLGESLDDLISSIEKMEQAVADCQADTEVIARRGQPSETRALRWRLCYLVDRLREAQAFCPATRDSALRLLSDETPGPRARRLSAMAGGAGVPPA
jgi:Trm5-related predicted tRNA methylase